MAETENAQQWIDLAMMGVSFVHQKDSDELILAGRRWSRLKRRMPELKTASREDMHTIQQFGYSFGVWANYSLIGRAYIADDIKSFFAEYDDYPVLESEKDADLYAQTTLQQFFLRNPVRVQALFCPDLGASVGIETNTILNKLIAAFVEFCREPFQVYTCAYCGTPMKKSRSDATVCSKSCNVQLAKKRASDKAAGVA